MSTIESKSSRMRSSVPSRLKSTLQQSSKAGIHTGRAAVTMSQMAQHHPKRNLRTIDSNTAKKSTGNLAAPITPLRKKLESRPQPTLEGGISEQHAN